MPSCSPTNAIRRARPLLGVVVSIEAQGEHAGEAVEQAFAEIAAVHRLMSFHEARSELSRINREAHLRPVAVDPRTHTVIEFALTLSRQSDGAFDISVAPLLVASGALPAPQGAPAPAAGASWRNIRITAEGVRFERPLWIDLGGVAKGYAVDCAIETLVRFGVDGACVNAGGDLRVFGSKAHDVLLRSSGGGAPVVTIENGALASSDSQEGRGVHFDAGRHCGSAFASVLAPNCMIADALTKVVLAKAEAAKPLLDFYGARGLLLRGAHWSEL